MSHCYTTKAVPDLPLINTVNDKNHQSAEQPCVGGQRGMFGRGKLSMVMYAIIKRGERLAKEVCVPAKLQSRCSERGRRWKDKY